MHKFYILNEIVEFHPVTSQLRNIANTGRVVVLNSPAARCLLLLIERAGEIVTQQEFMDTVWAGRRMQVSPNTYYQNICILRKGLKKIGFVSDPVVTVPRIGLTLASDILVTVSDKSFIKPSGESEPVVIQSILPPNVDAEGDLNDLSNSRNIEPLPEVTMPGVQATVPVVLQEKITVTTLCKRRHLLILGFMTVILSLGGGIFQSQAAQDRHYFDSYHFNTTIENCYFFLSENIQTAVGKAKAIDYGKRFRKSCESYPWIYINTYATLPRVSVIRCNRPMTEPNRCISDYFIEAH